MMKTNTILLSSIVSGLLILSPVVKAEDAAAPTAKAEKAPEAKKAKHPKECECGDCKKHKCEKKECEHCAGHKHMDGDKAAEKKDEAKK